jgi:Uma2 family endonuclease
MATVSSPPTRTIEYPTSDGKPMAETEIHRKDMNELIETLEDHFAAEPMVCVSGNLLMFYEEGNGNRHVSPDVFVVKGVERRLRDNYLIWEEGKGPDLVIELSSMSTSDEDMTHKKRLYQDILGVTEYILFDPKQEYLDPSLQGYRLVEGSYEPMELVHGRLPSEVLGLHFGREGQRLRLFDPETGQRLPTPRERVEQEEARAEQERARAEQAAAKAEQAAAKAEQAAAKAEQAAAEASQAKVHAEQAEARAERAEAEQERLRREVEELRRKVGGGA